MKHQNRKYKKLATIGALGVTAATAAYVEKRVLSMLFERDDKLDGDMREGKRYEYDWFDSKQPESIYINAWDQVQLHAYFFSQTKPSHEYMILFHGFHGYVKELSYEAKHFYNMGYQILMPSMRAHGLSKGSMITMGILEHLDAGLWIEEIKRRDPDARISLYGVSMGAATTLLTLAEKHDTYLRAAIADCAYTRIIDVFDFYLSQHLHIPYRWYLYASNDLIYHKTHISLKDARPIDVVDKITTPVLFIHGDADDLVPYTMLNELYDKAVCPKEKLTIHGAAHALSSSIDPITYWQHVDAFLKQVQDDTQ